MPSSDLAGWDSYPSTGPSWAVRALAPHQLRAILAHELGHHLGMPSRLSALVLWYSIPARVDAIALKRRWPALRWIPALAIGVIIFLTVSMTGLMLFAFRTLRRDTPDEPTPAMPPPG